jgi:hypothetical protein
MMSQQITESVDRAFPALLQTNIGSTCFRFLQIVKDRLERAGHKVQFIAKTNRDGGQYRPPGLGQHQIRGRDNNLYTLTGVSHDALYVDDEQRDVIISAVYQEEPYFENGRQVIAKPTWGEPVPHHEWRAYNPPLPLEFEKLFAPVPPPQHEQPPPPRPPASVFRLPSYGELGDAQFFRDVIGRRLEEDMHTNGEHMNAGSADWIARAVHGTIERFIKHGDHRDAEAIAKKVQNEWRAVMNNPKLPQLP